MMKILSFAVLSIALVTMATSLQATTDCKGDSREICNQFVSYWVTQGFKHFDTTCVGKLSPKGYVDCTASFEKDDRVVSITEGITLPAKKKSKK